MRFSRRQTLRAGETLSCAHGCRSMAELGQFTSFIGASCRVVQGARLQWCAAAAPPRLSIQNKVAEAGGISSTDASAEWVQAMRTDARPRVPRHCAQPLPASCWPAVRRHTSSAGPWIRCWAGIRCAWTRFQRVISTACSEQQLSHSRRGSAQRLYRLRGARHPPRRSRRSSDANWHELATRCPAGHAAQAPCAAARRRPGRSPPSAGSAAEPRHPRAGSAATVGASGAR